MNNTSPTNKNSTPAGGNAPTVAPSSKYKLVFLGDQSVGKTSIIHRFIYEVFDGKHQPTVGIDFVSKTVFLDDRSVRLQVWDTAGQERFRSLIPSYIKDSSVAVIVYDVTNAQTFKNVQRWYEDVRSQRGNDAIVALVANKIDIEDKRVVSSEEGATKAKELDVMFMELSAKTGANVHTLFKSIAQLLPGNENSQMYSSTAGNNPAWAATPQDNKTPGNILGNAGGNLKLDQPAQTPAGQKTGCCQTGTTRR